MTRSGDQGLDDAASAPNDTSSTAPMSQTSPQSYSVSAELANQTLAALLRKWLPGQSWAQVRKLVAGRRVKINGELWLDDARRLKEGDVVDVLERGQRQVQVLDTI